MARLLDLLRADPSLAADIKNAVLTRPKTVPNDLGVEVLNTGREGVPVTYVTAGGNTITDLEILQLPADNRPKV